jgi:tetratricopeptide (TPR) repeat protein
LNSGRDLLLNSNFLKNRIAELGIKQWWLAEQVGVDRKTVIRWTQGQVRSIQAENASALAQVLSCDIKDLTLSNEADQLATIDDQKSAAQLLAGSSLIDKLGPIGEWNVIEGLLRATIVPDLPSGVLAELYNQLTIASWRQSKIDQAEIYNRKAEDLAVRSNDKAVLAGALLSKANLLSWRGKTSKAIATYRECLSLEPYISPRTVGSIYSNLGAVLFESGQHAEGELYLRKALDCFALFGKPMNLSIAWCHLAMLYLETGPLEEAHAACLNSISFAEADSYLRGIAMGKLVSAEIFARRGKTEEAKKTMNDGLADFVKLGIEEGLNYEFAGRISLLLGQRVEAEAFLRKGISISAEFPLSRAALFFELAKLLSSRDFASEAFRLYSECDANQRSESVKYFIKSMA